MATSLDRRVIKALLAKAEKMSSAKAVLAKSSRQELDEEIEKLLERWKDLLKEPPIIVTDQASECAACAACAVCLADGPVPDFEPIGLVGLAGLA